MDVNKNEDSHSQFTAYSMTPSPFHIPPIIPSITTSRYSSSDILESQMEMEYSSNRKSFLCCGGDGKKPKARQSEVLSPKADGGPSKPMAQARTVVPARATKQSDKIPRFNRSSGLLPTQTEQPVTNIDRLIMANKQQDDRMSRLREQEVDEEEREILATIEERNNNRRFRHAKRKTVNGRVRGEKNRQMLDAGLLGLSPNVRCDSVIAWDSQVKTPLREKAERSVMPATPIIHPHFRRHYTATDDSSSETSSTDEWMSDISKKQPVSKETNEDDSVAIISDLETSMTKLMQSLRNTKPHMLREMIIERLAGEFSSLFFLLRPDHDEPEPCLVPQSQVELDALRVLRAECTLPDIIFFLDTIMAKDPDLVQYCNGTRAFVPPVKRSRTLNINVHNRPPTNQTNQYTASSAQVKRRMFPPRDITTTSSYHDVGMPNMRPCQ